MPGPQSATASAPRKYSGALPADTADSGAGTAQSSRSARASASRVRNNEPAVQSVRRSTRSTRYHGELNETALARGTAQRQTSTGSGAWMAVREEHLRKAVAAEVFGRPGWRQLHLFNIALQRLGQTVERANGTLKAVRDAVAKTEKAVLNLVAALRDPEVKPVDDTVRDALIAKYLGAEMTGPAAAGGEGEGHGEGVVGLDQRPAKRQRQG